MLPLANLPDLSRSMQQELPPATRHLPIVLLHLPLIKLAVSLSVTDKRLPQDNESGVVGTIV